MKKRLKKIFFTLMILGLGVGAGACCYFSQPKFGKLPEGERLERISRSPNYVDGEFKNQIDTPSFAEDSGFVTPRWELLLVSKERLRPSVPVPMLKTDLKALDPDRDVLVWLGHSSCYIQMGGKRILVDPVFNDHASPFSFANKAFDGDYPYAPEDMPPIDYLIISHDHWDHLDYPTLTALRESIGAVICPLGVGAHLEHWGFAPESLREADWYDVIEFDGLAVHVLPARHFSGRLLTRNKTLWAAFMLEAPGRRVFYSGDSGYGPHFAEIGGMFEGIDLAIMENGQYDKNWKYIHMMPEESAQAGQELKAGAVLPVHSGRFSIANHAWDEPFRRIVEASQGKSYRLITPKIGEAVYLDELDREFAHWWEGME